MSQPIITVENLSKSYLVGHEVAGRERYTALRDVVGRHVKNFGRKTLDMVRGRQIVQGDEVEEFWALKDVSFEVNEGEVVGIIGRNGAGKSTLLKILSRITEPTTGRVTLRGRVASLLEVGTGFHPELTGRENIFLNGAILGMTRAEIKRKFDEIVAFAEVERFLDTPVKRYSSGMYVRLAFAVAAHLEPEILVVDEVLAVGDSDFQKKCLGKMQDVARGGRTVLFVSHNMAAVKSLCPISLLLDHGSLAGAGSSEETINRYITNGSQFNTVQRVEDRPLGEDVILKSLEMVPSSPSSCQAAEIKLRLQALTDTVVSGLCMLIYSIADVRVAIIDLRAAEPYRLKAQQTLQVATQIDSLALVEGEYKLGLYVQATDTVGDFLGLTLFEVLPTAKIDGPTPYPAIHRGYAELNVSSLHSAYS